MPVCLPSPLLGKSLSSVFQETWGPSRPGWNSCVFCVPSTNFNSMLHFYCLFINLFLWTRGRTFLRTKNRVQLCILIVLHILPFTTNIIVIGTATTAGAGDQTQGLWQLNVCLTTELHSHPNKSLLLSCISAAC
jgi:hypothetical protein